MVQHRPTRTRPLAPFATLEDAFGVLTAEPNPLALDGTDIAGLPDRAIPLDELRSILLHPATPYDTRDAALGVLIARARSDRGRHLIGLAGVLVFGLRRAAAPLVECCPERVGDIEAEMLAGLVAAVRAAVPGRSRPAARLIWAARRSAEHVVRAELAERGRPAPTPVGAAPPRPFGHPDFVLARAVTEGIIDAKEAALIGATRLGESSRASAKFPPDVLT